MLPNDIAIVWRTHKSQFCRGRWPELTYSPGVITNKMGSDHSELVSCSFGLHFCPTVRALHDFLDQHINLTPNTKVVGCLVYAEDITVAFSTVNEKARASQLVVFTKPLTFKEAAALSIRLRKQS